MNNFKLQLKMSLKKLMKIVCLLGIVLFNLSADNYLQSSYQKGKRRLATLYFVALHQKQ